MNLFPGGWSMKRKVFWLVLTPALSLILLCGGLAGAQQKPLVLGGSLPLTGVWAETAKVIQKGYEFWVEETNARGGLLGRPIKLVIYDDEGKPDSAVKLAEKVITVDKVDLLLGGYPGTAARPVMSVAEKYKMVYVSMGGHMASFT